MNLKDELIELIERLPEQEIPNAILFLKRLVEENNEMSEPVPLVGLDALDTFMATVINSLTNTMYDLSADARRRDDKIMANRLEIYRKKVSEGWVKYKNRKDLG